MHNTENYMQNYSTTTLPANCQPDVWQQYKSQDVLTGVALISFFI